MKQFFRKYLNVLILALLFFTSISLLSSNIVENRQLSFGERVLMEAMAPFQKAIHTSFSGIIRAWDNYVDLLDAKKENRRLEMENDRLRFENNILLEKNLFFRRLGSLFAFTGMENFRLGLAQVVGKDFTPWNQMVIIGKGSRHGVERDMPVSTHRGLVGRTVFVSDSVSKVLLITDIRSSVDSLIQRTRDSCVVVGYTPKLCNVKYLSVDADVREGDHVISSGMGGLFPKGLVIGTVARIGKQTDGLFREAKVIPSANLTRLEELFVFLDTFDPERL